MFSGNGKVQDLRTKSVLLNLILNFLSHAVSTIPSLGDRAVRLQTYPPNSHILRHYFLPAQAGTNSLHR